MPSSKFDKCPECGLSGVYEIHDWTWHPGGTSYCKFCYTVSA